MIASHFGACCGLRKNRDSMVYYIANTSTTTSAGPSAQEICAHFAQKLTLLFALQRIRLQKGHKNFKALRLLKF